MAASAEKTSAIILSVAPYRETSCIIRLFTNTRGLVHGIAKGIRKGGKNATPVERGTLCELMLYYKPNRDLHIVSGISTAIFFDNTRRCITRSIVRDIALELYLKTITQPETHTELFELLQFFLTELDARQDDKRAFLLLWRFIYEYCGHAGFAMTVDSCRSCGMSDDIIEFVAGYDVDVQHGKQDSLTITDRMLFYVKRHFDVGSDFNSLNFAKSFKFAI